MKLLCCRPYFAIFTILFLSFNVAFSSNNDRLLLEKPCDFDCIHGRCDTKTRSCVCLPGWLGAGCDLCAFGMACHPSEPRLALILPQDGQIGYSNQSAAAANKFVYAHGYGFPRGPDGQYACLFGSTEASPGQWLSSSLIRCALPQPANEAAKLAFSLVPAGSHKFIPYQQEWGMSHFTYFAPCISDQCQGHCFGPICLCPRAKFSVHCEQTFLGPLNGTYRKVDQLEMNDSALTIGHEFRPYLAKLPVQNDVARFRLHSDIIEDDLFGNGGLQLDPFQGLLYWPSTRGRHWPYQIGIGIEHLDGSIQQLNWSMRIRPSYSGRLNRQLPLVEGSNARRLNGQLEWSTAGGVKPSVNGSIPLLLQISTLDSTGRHIPIEEIPIWTDPTGQQTFGHSIFPYLAGPDKIFISIRHPGSDLGQHLRDIAMDDATLEWIQEKVQVNDFPAEFTVNSSLASSPMGNGTLPSLLLLNYSLGMAPLNGDCLGGWQFEVIEPRELWRVERAEQNKTNGSEIQLYLRPNFDLAQNIPSGNQQLRIAFICMPTGQSLIVRQTLQGLLANPNEQKGNNEFDSEINPKRLFVDLAQSSLMIPVLSLDIQLPPDRANQFSRSQLESASFAPFNLVWSSRLNNGNWRLWLAPKSEEMAENKEQKSVDGALIIQGTENLALSVPYRIQQSSMTAHFHFTLTVKNLGGLRPSQINPHEIIPNWHVDVELFSQSREQQFFRTILLNTPDQFGPLKADLFQLRIKSRHFLPYSKLIRIDPLDNAQIVELEPRPAQYFAFDGQKFHSELEVEKEGVIQPIVEFNPAIFSAKNATFNGQFVDFIYKNGPPNSFVTISPEWENGPTNAILSFPMAFGNSTICLGCGFRQFVQIQSDELAKLMAQKQKCAAHLLEISFLAHLPAGSSPAQLKFSQHFLIATDNLKENKLEGELPKICPQNDDFPGEFAFRTKIHRNCPLAHLRLCRPLFHPFGPRCQKWWHQLADDLISVHSLGQFMLMAADCRVEGNQMDKMAELMECIGRVDRDCPLHPVEMEMGPHIGGQLFNQIGHLKPFRAGLESLFPALGLVESQLVNFPSLMADFLRNLNAVFPPPFLAPFISTKFYDQFVAAIGTKSPNGTAVDWAELDAVIGDGHQSVHSLVHRWNWLGQMLEGNRLDLLESGTEANVDLERIRALVQSSDLLKSMTRQFGADNPFAFLRDVLHRIFDNVSYNGQTQLNGTTTAEGDWEEQIIGWVDVRLEPKEPVEGEEFRVFANLQIRELISSEMTGIGLDLRFVQPSPLKFRIGPVHNSGPNPLGAAKLESGQRLHVDWTVLPVPEFRLTESVQQQLDLTLSFELSGQRRAQRIRTPTIRIRPKPSVHLLAFAHPTISSSSASSFSLLISAINSGYSPLDSVQILQLRPQIVPAEIANPTGPMDFRIGGVRLELPEGSDGNAEELGQMLAFGPIPSGKASHLALNITLADTNKLALFRNFSALVSVNGAFLTPGQFDQRFFLIQDWAPRRDHQYSMLVVSEYSSPLPLYLFTKSDNALTPLSTLQLIEEKEARLQLNGHPFLTRAFALRRIVIFPPISTMPGGTSNGTYPTIVGAVLASLSVDTAQTFGNGAKLLRVAELGPQGRQRPVDMSRVWIGHSSDEKTTVINFVDNGASAAVPQLIYELLFGRPEHFRTPFFPQPLYQLHLATPIVPIGQQVLARIEAISPTNRPLNYSLWSPDESSPFSIVPSTGDLVVNSPLPAQAEFCLNLAATDSEGHSARIPLQINVIGVDSPAGTACQLFGESTKLYDHEFRPMASQNGNGDSDLLMMITLAPGTEGGGKEGEEYQYTVPMGDGGRWQEMVPKEKEEEEEIGGETKMQIKPSSFHSPTTIGLIVVDDSTLPSLNIASGQLATTDEQISLETTQNEIGDEEIAASMFTMAPIPPGTVNEGIGEENVPSSTIDGQTPMPRFGGQTTKWPTAILTTNIRPTSSAKIISGPIGGSQTRPGTGGRKLNGTLSAAGGIQREGKGDEVPMGASANQISEMACRMRATKPIWALICDMAKTVYRTTLQNV